MNLLQVPRAQLIVLLLALLLPIFRVVLQIQPHLQLMQRARPQSLVVLRRTTQPQPQMSLTVIAFCTFISQLIPMFLIRRKVLFPMRLASSRWHTKD